MFPKILEVLASGDNHASMKSDSEKTAMEILEVEYLKRKQKNAAFSLRAFARVLDLNSGRLSQLLSGKRPFTPFLIDKVGSKLGWSPQQILTFKNHLHAPLLASQRSEIILAEEKFKVISDPIHLSMLALMQTSNFKSDEHWMTQRLNINIVKVRQVLKRLESLELVKKVNDQWVLTNERLDTSSDMQSAANLHYHKSCLKEVEEAMEEVHLEMRELTSITFAADVEKLKSAKMLIRDFRWQICELLNKGNPQEVYRLNIQLIPVTKIKGEKS